MSQEGNLRDRAYELMTEWTPSEALQRHMLAVEAAVVAYAREEGADEDGHPYVGVRYLREHGWPEELCEAILGHADYTGVPRTSRLARVLYACDEITGLVTAAVLVRPDKDIAGQTVKSLKKKFKDKAFARGVHRDEVARGAEELGVDLWEHVGFVLAAMQDRADALALDGRLA